MRYAYAFSFLLCRKTNVGPIPPYPYARNARNIWPLHCHVPIILGLAYYKDATKSIIVQNVKMINMVTVLLSVGQFMLLN